MMQRWIFVSLFVYSLAGCLMFTFSACGTPQTTAESSSEITTSDAADSHDTANSDTPMAMPFGNPEDIKIAQDLWKEMADYRKWERFPGKEGDANGFVASASPHGMFARIYVNKKNALSDDGSIIIKENYGEKDEAKVMAITVMKKIKGFNPDDGDWFWVKFSPQGGVDKDGDVSMAGKVGKGMPNGCIPCHGQAKSRDYIMSKSP